MVNVKLKLKNIFFGNREKSGLIVLLAIYIILIGLGFVFLYPVLYMFVNSFKSASDIVDPSVTWVPISLCFENFQRAYLVLDYPKSLLRSLAMSLGPAMLQTLSLAFISYGLARFRIPGKKFWIIMLIAAYIIPSQVTLVPQYIQYESLKLINTPFVSLLPSLLGQGIKSSIFVLVFYQFYSTYPKSFDEAAEIDGAGAFQTWWKIALPMVGPALLVTFLFTFIWNWNETDKSGMFFGSAIPTLPMKLQNLVDTYSHLYETSDYSATNKLNEAIRLAGTLLTIAPLLIIYTVIQRYFIESIERSGITGE